MQRLTLDSPIPAALRGAIVALGNFDGFHRGHQAVVGRAVQRGADMIELDVPAMIHVSGCCNPAQHTTGSYYLTPTPWR